MDDLNNMDGVVPPNKRRSIKDIPIPARRRSSKEASKERSMPDTAEIRVHREHPVHSEEQEDVVPVKRSRAREYEDEPTFDPGKSYKKTGGSKKTLITIASIIVVLVIIFIPIANLLSGAKISITPKQKELSNISFSLPIVSAVNIEANSLVYKPYEITEMAAVSVDSENEETVESSAVGTITIYNEYSAEPQKLIQKTRFETPEGLIYRIQESATVPGYTESGGAKVPGSVDAKVVADIAGEQYNIGEARFTIPGFKGQEQFDKMYAKSKSAMVGGFSGVKKTVSDNTLNSKSESLKQEIVSKIKEKINSEKTDGYVYLFDEGSIQFEKPYQEEENGKVSIKIKGTAKVYIVKLSELSQKIAEKEVADYKGEDILVANPESLQLSVQGNAIEGADGEAIETTNLNVSGQAKLIWQINKENVKKQALNRKESDLAQILSSIQGAESVKSSISPFWKNSFPSSPDKIEVIVNVE